MRCMKRNQVSFYYCPYASTEPIVDASGHKTGETKVIYGEAVCVSANISSAAGEVQTELFGNLEGYEKVIVIDDPAFPMDENSVLFIDKSPVYGEDGTPLCDYKVKKVARSLNSVAYAVAKDEVS